MFFFFVEFRSIQKFIFRSPELKQIRGSSELIIWINKLIKEEFSKINGREAIVNEKGGSFLGICTFQQYKFIKKAIIKRISNELKGLDSNLDSDEILKRLDFHPLHTPFSLSEIFFGSEQMGYDFNKIWNEIQLTPDNTNSEEHRNAILSYFNINPHLFDKMTIAAKKFYFFSNFIRKRFW